MDHSLHWQVIGLIIYTFALNKEKHMRGEKLVN